MRILKLKVLLHEHKLAQLLLLADNVLDVSLYLGIVDFTFCRQSHIVLSQEVQQALCPSFQFVWRLSHFLDDFLVREAFEAVMNMGSLLVLAKQILRTRKEAFLNALH